MENGLELELDGTDNRWEIWVRAGRQNYMYPLDNKKGEGEEKEKEENR